MVKFVIYGQPKGKGRPRFSRQGTYVKTVTPTDTVNYENLVKIEYGLQTNNYMFPDGSSLKMEINAYYAIPKSTSNKKRKQMLEDKLRPTKKPDVDNVVKIIADSLNKVAYKDDTQITDLVVKKRYSQQPRVEVIISETEEPE